MPRKLRPAESLDVFEDEVIFTIAALQADPDAEDLLEHTDDWLERIDKTRATDRDMRVKVASIDARRAVANGRLDESCTEFGLDLQRAVSRDTTSPRWRQFFNSPISVFVRRALDRQVSTVQGWLAQSQDEALEPHRAELTTWANRAADALRDTSGAALLRGQARIAREALAEDLTRERDALRDALAQRARDRKHPRDWPDLFFRTSTRPAASEEPSPEEPSEP
jgi:hypothetical protein